MQKQVQHELKAQVIQGVKEEIQNGEIEDATCDSDDEQMLETEDEKEVSVAMLSKLMKNCANVHFSNFQDEHQMMAWVVANPEIVMEEASDAVQSTNQDDILKETSTPIQVCQVLKYFLP